MSNKKCCLIFGGSGGLGQIVSKELEKEYRVISLDSKQGDITDIELLDLLMMQCVPDIVLSLVGVSNSAKLDNINIEQTNAEIDLMIKGHLNLLKSSLSYMKERNSGKIIFVSSVLRNKKINGTGVYASIKAMIERLIEQAAFEYGRYGITANCIRLGYFDAGMIKKVPEKILENTKQEIPCKKLGDPIQLANLIKTIDDNDYINGSVLDINGGL